MNGIFLIFAVGAKFNFSNLWKLRSVLKEFYTHIKQQVNPPQWAVQNDNAVIYTAEEQQLFPTPVFALLIGQ